MVCRCGLCRDQMHDIRHAAIAKLDDFINTSAKLPATCREVTMEPPLGHDRNADQIAYWNGPGGQHWTDRQAVQDILLAPISHILIAAAAPKPGNRIIDIGCGCG